MLCSGRLRSRDGLTEISGAVTYDGQPVKKGTISFLRGWQGPHGRRIITDGKYAVRVAPGQKLVRIEGFKVVGQHHYVPNDPTSPMIDIQEQILPERYNAKSELTCEITADAHGCDFTLSK